MSNPRRSRPDPGPAAVQRDGGRGRPVSAGRRWTPGRLALVGVASVAAALLLVRGIVGWSDARARALEAECKRAHQAGRYAEEERLAREWEGVAPGEAAPIFFLAEALLGQGKQREAADTFARLPDGDPLTLTGLSDRVDLLFGDLRDPHEAARTCERIIAQDPGNVDAHRRLCFYDCITLDRARLAEHARRAIERGAELPETYVYLVGSDWMTLSNTLSVNSHWLKGAPDDETFLVAAARGFVNNAGLEDDVAGESPDEKVEPEHDRRLRELLARFPGNVELLAYFLQKATTRGDLDMVTELLGQAPPEAADDNRFWRFKGWVHDQGGELEEAEAAHRKALAIEPFDFLSQHQLAAVLRKRGRAEEAARLTALAADGRALRKRILQAPDVRAMPPDVLREIVAYARGCGQPDIAARLERRIEQIGVVAGAAGGGAGLSPKGGDAPPVGHDGVRIP